MANGDKGKFSERLKRIAFMKRRGKKILEQEEEYSNNLSWRFKRTLLIPVMFLEGMVVGDKYNDNKNNLKKDKILVEKKDININNDNDNDNDKVVKNTRRSVNSYRRIIKNRKNSNNDEIINANNFVDNKKLNNNKEIELLEKEILSLIKKRLVKLVNEYEILGSDFFVLEELLTDDIYYDKCVENIKEIKKLLSKISSLKDKYDYLKDNIDFDGLLNLDDGLEDKIILLKNKLETDDLSYLVKDYKLFKEYQVLYLKIDKLQNDAFNYEDERIKKCAELKMNEKDFENFKKTVYNHSEINNSYIKFIKDQDLFLKELNDKIGVIDSYEEVNYVFKGYRQLLANSFKYMGLLLLSPLKGIIPEIAVQTVISKNILDNLKSSITLEEHRKMVYKAVDYTSEINVALNDIDHVSNMIDSSLNDIENLKRLYDDRFRKYQGNYREYQTAIKQLNKIENSIIGNKIKVEIMKKRMEVNKKVNEDKLVKVRKLNSQ